MSLDAVAIVVESTKYEGWTSVQIRRSIETLAAVFSFGSIDNEQSSTIFTLKPGLACQIKIGSNKIIDGYIDQLSPSISKNEHSLQIRGRCKTSDLIDCSAMNTPGSWNNPIGLQKLCYELVRPFGLRVIKEANDLGEDLRGFSINTGQSPFEVIRSACEMRAVLPIANIDGDLVLTSAGNERSHDAIAYGWNVISAKSMYDYSERFSEYIVKGSRSSDGDGWSSSNVQIFGKATDVAISRYRPKLILADGQATNKLAQTRAAWEGQVRAGRSADVTVRLQGWRQSNGALWRENQLVIVDIIPLRIRQTEMIISQITYSYDAVSGQYCDVLLRRPEAYQADPTKKVKQPKRTRSAGWE